jgi:hypothetical protein
MRDARPAVTVAISVCAHVVAPVAAAAVMSHAHATAATLCVYRSLLLLSFVGPIQQGGIFSCVR